MSGPEKAGLPPSYAETAYPPPPPAGYAPPPGAPPPGGSYPPPEGGYGPPPEGGYGPPPQGGYGPPPPQGGYAPPGPGGYPQGGYPPPQGYGQPGAGGYPQQPPPPPGQVVTPIATTTVIVQGPGFGRGGFGRNAVNMQCPHCLAQIVTATEHSVGTANWIVVGIIALIGLFFFPFILLGCCFIPLCIPSLKDVNHSCPNCQKFLGTYKHNL